MAENLADEGWIVFVRSEASGAAVYLVGLATERDSEIAVRGRYPNKAIKIEQLVRCKRLTAKRPRKGNCLSGEELV
jgi:hypothetical protein